MQKLDCMRSGIVFFDPNNALNILESKIIKFQKSEKKITHWHQPTLNPQPQAFPAQHEPKQTPLTTTPQQLTFISVVRSIYYPKCLTWTNWQTWVGLNIDITCFACIVRAYMWCWVYIKVYFDLNTSTYLTYYHVIMVCWRLWIQL